MEGLVRGIYSISEWVLRLVYVNLLWIFFSMVGLFIFGLFPATIAMFAVVRKWVYKETEIPVFKTFWTTYKSEFMKSNALGLVFFMISLILYFNMNIIHATTVPLFKLLYIPNLVIILLFVLTFLYVIPVFVHFEVPLVKVIKDAFFLMILNPKATFCMVTLSGTLCFILVKFPGLLPFFSGSLLAYLLMWFSKYVFLKIESTTNNVAK
ncbi:YesL family protein [Fredinandcohnia quinoae]|uniref:YesL family protein n=1 Tax=Fredinandcohnia quinoae TaxID=2918902 RepID=A0AAW5DYF9_9BACI|nr:YesL family protein [Fredinandcohnia sp. SECRCQ15]MCH1624359.1 YesL family protein [Fredinandcohnia sp. SECRCQ15]